MFDILFRNAKVIDGTGNPWFYGDVGVEGGTVAAVLPPGSTARARRVAGTAIRNCRSSPGKSWTARSCRA